eukprot:SAG31_NODE_3830_length_3842_cov_2.970345_2_plen_271_part_00
MSAFLSLSCWRSPFDPTLAVAVISCADKLEATQPEAFAELYQEYSMKHLDVKADGTIHALGRIHLDPSVDPKGLTWWAATWATSTVAGLSPAVLDVYIQDMMTMAKHPYVRELPQSFFDLMAADLDGPLAEDYRGYIRHEVKPTLDRITDLMQTHFSAIEPPPLEWLLEMFPGHGQSDTPNQIMDSLVGYALAWNRVLADWSAGHRLDVLHPPNHMMPFISLAKFNHWSRERGEAKQHELIGMSSNRKDGATKQMAAVMNSASFENEEQK